MTRVERPLDFVRSPATDARVAQQWAAIENAGLPGMPKPRARARLAWAAGAFAVAATAAAFVVITRQPARVPDGALVLSAEEPIGVRLEDGSRLQLSPRSRMQLIKNEPAAVELELRGGRAHFDVTHNRKRSFHVRAGLADVRVVGTRFDVERTPQAGGSLVRVTVLEGIVEVRRRDQPQDGSELRRLHAGESWSALLGSAPQTKAAQAPSPVEPAEPAEPADNDAQEAAEPSDEAEPGASNAVGGTASALRGDAISGTASALRGDAISGTANGSEPNAREAAAHDAARVFKRANLARRAGRMREAAEGYAELLARHPNDGRAGVSAFELGRIRMDALNDATGAIDALERALASTSMSSFHEDAMARIVVANDALGRIDACRRARDRYLVRYPEGVHLRALAARCQ